MADELLDLLDEQGNIIGEVWRSEANLRPGLIHPEVSVFLVDLNDRVLLQKRSQKKTIWPGVWTSAAAGHVGKGEIPEDVAHRELQEELGFDADLKFVRTELQYLENETHLTYWYAGKYDGQEITIDTSEVEEVRFFPKEVFESFVRENTVGVHTQEFSREYWSSAS